MNELDEICREIKRKDCLPLIVKLLTLKSESLHSLIAKANTKDEAWDIRTALKVTDQLKAEITARSVNNKQEE